MELPSSPKYTRSTSAWGATLTPRRTLAKTRGTQTKRKPHTPGWDEGFSFLKGQGWDLSPWEGAGKEDRSRHPKKPPHPCGHQLRWMGPEWGTLQVSGRRETSAEDTGCLSAGPAQPQCRPHCRRSTGLTAGPAQSQCRPHCSPSTGPVQASLQAQHNPSAGLTAAPAQAPVQSSL